MSLFNSLDRNKHFSEFSSPLASAEGVLSPAVRRNRALANLMGNSNLQVGADGFIDLTTSSASTDGGTSVRPFHMVHTMTGVGGVGGRAEFEMTTNVALGSWSNALKGLVTYGAAGRTNGLGSAVLAEMVMSAGCTQGTYAPLEVELGLPENAVLGTKTSLMTLNVYGNATAVGGFDDAGYLMDIQGLTAASTVHLFRTGLTGATVVSSMTAALKIKVGATDYFIPLATATA